jgi:hypothetical protein
MNLNTIIYFALVGKANKLDYQIQPLDPKFPRDSKKSLMISTKVKSTLKPFQISRFGRNYFCSYLALLLFYRFYLRKNTKENSELTTYCNQMKEIQKKLNFFDNFFSMMLSTLELGA